MRQRSWFIFYAAWVVFALGAPFGREGLSPPNITRLVIVAYFVLLLGWYGLWGKKLTVRRPKLAFYGLGLIGAVVGETAYMISRPLDPSLTVTAQMLPETALRHLAVDLLLTMPAYLMIFTVIWWLASRFDYSPFAYFFLMALGQTAGDGNAFFLINPGALLFLPYVMFNYQAMNFVPWLLAREHLSKYPKSNRRWLAVVAPLIALPVTYFVAASIILTIGRAVGWLPRTG